MIDRPNLLIISIDSLRPDHLSAYGYHRETTPHLTELAMQGVLFKNAFSASNWTGSAVTSLLTGRYPTSHGYTNRRYYLDDEVPTLAEQLQRVGYRTACFSNNLYITPQTGLHRGFDRFFYRGVESVDDKNSVSSREAGAVQPAAWRWLKRQVPLAAKTILRDSTDLIQAQKSLTRDDGAWATEQSFCRWLPQVMDRPFFAFIHYQEPHSPYFPPKPYRRRFFPEGWFKQWHYLEFDPVRYYGGEKTFTQRELDNHQALYDGEITYLDWRIGRLFDLMQRNQAMDNTVIIVTADHGECFGENGYVWHAFNLYDSLIRIPLIVRYDAWFARNRVEDRLVQSVDILATMIQGLGLIPEENDGSSLLREARDAVYLESDSAQMMVARWLQKQPTLRESDFSQYLRDLYCCRTLTQKLIWTSDGRHEFYDLTKDSGESCNLYGQDSRADKFVQQLHKWRSQLKPHVANATQPGFDKGTWEKLKALGYA